jgi:hypothetical protein
MKQRTPRRTSKARTAAVPRPRVYLDSTIPSAYCDQREGNRYETEMTCRWWREESARYEIWASPATMAELEDGNHPHKAEILEFADALDLLPPDEAVDALANHYITNLVMPRKHLGDAWHLAYATFHGFEFLLTWNCNHLANANKRRHLETINWRMGFETPEIVTPLELFKEREDL